MDKHSAYISLVYWNWNIMYVVFFWAHVMYSNATEARKAIIVHLCFCDYCFVFIKPIQRLKNLMYLTNVN